MARQPGSHVAVVVALFVLAPVGGRSLVAASVAGVLPVALASPVAQPPATQPEPPTRTDAPAIEASVPIPYPDEARVAGIQGPVVLSVTTDLLGQPTSVQAVTGEPVLTTAAIDAVGQWRFAPSDVPKAFMLAVNVVPRDPLVNLSTSAALRVGGDGAVRPPTKTHHVNPAYPGEAKDAGVQGIVIMQVRIGIDGIVDSAVVVRSVAALDAAALFAVAQWRFTPTLLNGAPVPVLMTVTVDFTLK